MLISGCIINIIHLTDMLCMMTVRRIAVEVGLAYTRIYAFGTYRMRTDVCARCQTCRISTPFWLRCIALGHTHT